MKRRIEPYLLQWLNSTTRKPLILRGARQVGKTHAVRELAKQARKPLVEINLDEERDLWQIFSLEPQQIIEELAVLKGLSVTNSMLFIDEIQACPLAIAALRYLYERFPELPVLAAGSLLDFALAEFKESIPVGRVEFAYLYPMSFSEFVRAIHSEQLADYLDSFEPERVSSDALHLKVMQALREYYVVGGMPEVVEVYRNSRDIGAAQRVQSALIQTFEVDFLKYGSKPQQTLLAKVYRKIPASIGKKIKYSNLAPESRSAQVREVVQLLKLAGLIHLVHRTAANGVPLAAERDDDHYKPIFLDIGLVHHVLGLRIMQDVQANDMAKLLTVMEGAMAEQFVGQELIANNQHYERKELHYWHREAKSSNAEVDYIESRGQELLPIEIKAGSAGSLRSLHQLMKEKKIPTAYRFWSGSADRTSITTKDPTWDFTLISLPMYYAAWLAKQT
jgi:uncharacterized protein